MHYKKGTIAFMLMMSMLSSAIMAEAQTVTDSNIYETTTGSGDVITTTGTTDMNNAAAISAPGTPNTGAGGNAPLNSLLLILSSFGIIAGGFYLNRLVESE